VTLTTTDSGGLTDTESIRLDPRTRCAHVQVEARGAQARRGRDELGAPFTRTVILGSTNSVSALSPQTLGGATYAFRSWSDGAAQTHNITASRAATYTATYRRVR
jgi:hypothetical protein